MMAPHNVLDFVSNVANEVSQRLPQALESLPASINENVRMPRNKNLDVTCITERILATSKPAEAPIPTRNDTGRDGALRSTVASTNAANASLVGSDSSQQQQHHDEPSQPQHVSSSGKPKPGINPGTLSTFLSRRYGTKYLAINLSEEYPDDRTLLLLNRQVLTKGWSSPCLEKSETPRLPHILDICYAMHAFLSLDPENVVLVYCANGRTRTAIVIAAYLKYARIVPTSLQGFQLFLSKRCPHLDPNATLDNIPPSLVTFFRNFDSCLQLGTVMNPKPLLLRAIAVQGVPVDDKPCIDIWDSSSQHHVYASNDNDSLSQWADEEGFYRVNRVLEGDFVLLCRFGGPYMDETNDPSKVLFRYANTTGFLASGPYELPKPKVDMMRRYVQSFDPEDFSLTLLFESYWDCTDDTHKQQLQQECNNTTVMPPVLLPGRNAKEKGWHLITEQHAARPEAQDVDALKRTFPDLQECPMHICKLALQLTNFNLNDTRNMLYTGSMKSWWRQEESSAAVSERGGSLVESDTENDPPPAAAAAAATNTDEQAKVVPDPRCLEILRIVDEVVGEGGSQAHSDGVSSQRENYDATAATRSQHQTTRQADDPKMLYQGIMFPNRGDIVNAFGDYYKGIHGNTGKPRLPPREGPLELGCKPRMPIIPRKRIRPQEEEQAKKRPSVDPFGQIGGFHNPGGANGDLVYDEDLMAAMEIYQQINHTGVTLEDLIRTQADSTKWNYVEEIPTNQVESKKKKRRQSSTGSVGDDGERVGGHSTGVHPTNDSLSGVGGQEAINGDTTGTSVVGIAFTSGRGTEGGVGNGSTGGGANSTTNDVALPQAATASNEKSGEGKVGKGNVPSTEGEKEGSSSSGTGEGAVDKDISGDEVPLKLDPEYQKVRDCQLPTISCCAFDLISQPAVTFSISLC